MILTTVGLERFGIKAKGFICKLSSFNQNVGGGDDTPMMDGWQNWQYNIPKVILLEDIHLITVFDYNCYVMMKIVI